MTFVMWRLWKFKISMDDSIRGWCYEESSKCWCCITLDQKTMVRVFLKSQTANMTWPYFFFFCKSSYRMTKFWRGYYAMMEFKNEIGNKIILLSCSKYHNIGTMRGKYYVCLILCGLSGLEWCSTKKDF